MPETSNTQSPGTPLQPKKKPVGGSKGNLLAPGTANNNVGGSRSLLFSSARATMSTASKDGNKDGGAAGTDDAPLERTYENTYIMAPDRKFVGGPLKQKMDAHLKTKLGNVVYTAETAPEICKQICNEIQAMAKELQYERYKYIVTCDLCEVKGQSFRVSSRSVWDTKTDVCISSSFKNKTLIAVATLFAMYYE